VAIVIEGADMINRHSNREINDLLGSAVVFASAVNDLMADHLEEVGRGEITFAQLRLLKLLALKGRLSVTDMADFMGISPAAASKGIDRLERLGMLERAEARRDRRAVRVSLTAKARALLERYDRATSSTLGEIFGGVSKRRLAALTRSLDELSVSVVHHDDHAEDSCFRCGIYFRDKCLLRGMLNRTCYMDLHEANPEAMPKSGETVRGMAPT
jgi:DNA-binding MarR family transcriptional regulator